MILALVFLTMEIQSQLAPAGFFCAPLINWVILVNYVLLCPSFGWTILTGRWLKHKDRVNPPQFVYNTVQVRCCHAHFDCFKNSYSDFSTEVKNISERFESYDGKRPRKKFRSSLGLFRVCCRMDNFWFSSFHIILYPM